ncbi:hypothetical protein [Legionella bononiensis]|uniref:Uncharacterized protein n=1 Tax=Legionella bononiensis TaxID=2793102 RepID=A0ABS1W9B5_9GAMM|nr:hypothetical protein [Legionella bononiensis]MBL7480882.1 hypothetical protein [Legionella bononiensis]MBL7525936.1 hypothetical protein [Legionella bononiensis]MBL7563997.1 hypothetical protein [Legionella bononiensis]
MHNSIIEVLTGWLTAYRNDDDSSQKALAEQLINQLKAINSTQELLDILHKTSNVTYKDSRFTFFSDIEFFKQIDLWLNQLDELIQTQKSASQKLLTINPKLSTLFKELGSLLDDPGFLLHQSASQLLELINDDTTWDSESITTLYLIIINDMHPTPVPQRQQEPDAGCILM